MIPQVFTFIYPGIANVIQKRFTSRKKNKNHKFKFLTGKLFIID